MPRIDWPTFWLILMVEAALLGLAAWATSPRHGAARPPAVPGRNVAALVARGGGARAAGQSRSIPGDHSGPRSGVRGEVARLG